MTTFTRRTMVKGGTALAATGALAGPALLDWAKAWAQTAPWKPEKGAQLSMLRWKYFVQSEDDAFMALIDAFTKATGVKVSDRRESFEDVPPKASVAANTGAGPDLFWGLYSLPHLFPQKCLDVTDVADYLGKKYGGWVPTAVAYGKSGNKWIALPICYNGNMLNYRISSLKKAGFSKFPGTTDEFLEYAKATKRNNTPGGMALGHASGDGNSWVHWCLWAHRRQRRRQERQGHPQFAGDGKGARTTPSSSMKTSFRGRVLERRLQQQGFSGGRDPLDQQRHLDLRRRQDGPEAQGDRRGHGPRAVAGRPGRQADRAAPDVPDAGDELHQESAGLQGADGLHAGGGPVQQVARGIGRLSHASASTPTTPIRYGRPTQSTRCSARRPSAHSPRAGSVRSARRRPTALADFVVLDMFANFCTGREDAKGAIAIADRQLRRIYRSDQHDRADAVLVTTAP